MFFNEFFLSYSSFLSIGGNVFLPGQQSISLYGIGIRWCRALYNLALCGSGRTRELACFFPFISMPELQGLVQSWLVRLGTWSLLAMTNFYTSIYILNFHFNPLFSFSVIVVFYWILRVRLVNEFELKIFVDFLENTKTFSENDNNFFRKKQKLVWKFWV